VWALVPVRGVFRQVTGNGTVSAADDVTGLAARRAIASTTTARRPSEVALTAAARSGRPRADDRQVVFRPGWGRDHAETLGDLFHRRICQPQPVREDAQRQRRWLYFGDSQDCPHRVGLASVDPFERVTVAVEESRIAYAPREAVVPTRTGTGVTGRAS
jgi:hypothetical protein